MRIHFVYPRWEKLLDAHPALKQTLSGFDLGGFRMAGIGVCAAVASLPDGHDVLFSDQNAGEVDCATPCDLAAVSFFTPQAMEAYALGDAFRRRGVPAIAGGIHPSMLAEECLEHFDSVVCGPVEGLWPRILADLAAGRLERIYQGDPHAGFSQPRRELFAASGYLRSDVVQTARGCPLRCSFCVLSAAAGERTVRRDIRAVVEDIAGLPHACFFFGDENLLFPDAENRAYTKRLLNQLAAAGNRRRFFLASYPRFVRAIKPAMARLLAAAGCRQIYLVTGFMAPLTLELRDPVTLDAIHRLQDQDIELLATFTLGNDADPPEVDDLVLDFARTASLNLAEFTLFTPFPGSEAFARLEREGRILTRDWSRYNGAHAVFVPRGQSAGEMEARFAGLWRAFYEPLDDFSVHARCLRGFGREIFEARDGGRR